MVSIEQSKKDILVVLGSGRWGGGEKNCIDLISKLRHSFNFTVIHCPGEMISEILDKKKIRRYEFPLHKSPSPSKIYHFIKLIKKVKPYLIHSHLNRANLYLSLAKPWLNCKWISSVHGFTSQIYNILPDHLICVSKAIQNDLPTIFRRKSTLIYNGIEQLNQNHRTSISKKRSVNSKENMHALVLATIHPNKGQIFVCEALRNYESDVTIKFVGTGCEKNTQELINSIGETANTELENNVVSNIEFYLEQADFVIIPSYKEALSYVAIESLSYGIPVLASRTGGLLEVITEEFNGYFFQPGNISSFRIALEKMVLNCQTLKQNLIEKPFLVNNIKFTLNHMTDGVRSLYEDTLVKNEPPRDRRP
tara:strand:- start:7847 stop:8941 length:1095 start_codon:yes stop_codon:yes gene_type:complete